MTRPPILLVLVLVLVLENERSAVCDAAEFDATKATMEELLPVAVRYGDTQERRDLKELARQEIVSRKPVSFRYLMTQIHLENVGIQVLAQEMVDQMTADDAVPVLLDFVGAEHPDTRRAAAFFLGFYPSGATNAPALRPLLADDKTRNAAIRTLGKWHSTSDMTALARFLGDPKERTRVMAANALRDIDDARAVPYLLDALNDPVFTVRNTAQRAIEAYGHRAQDELLSALPVARPPALRLIIQSLGRIRCDQAYRTLKDLTRDDDPLVRADAREALKHIRVPLVDRIF
jgi:hypothetical protein